MLKHPLVDPDSRNELGDTPLHTYIRKAYSNRFKLLFSLLSCNRKVDIDAYDSDENTPLHIAVRVSYFHSNVVKPCHDYLSKVYCVIMPLKLCSHFYQFLPSNVDIYQTLYQIKCLPF
jgi:ankyrin repeat protein